LIHRGIGLLDSVSRATLAFAQVTPGDTHHCQSLEVRGENDAEPMNNFVSFCAHEVTHQVEKGFNRRIRVTMNANSGIYRKTSMDLGILSI
jgi:hypothetical protein